MITRRDILTVIGSDKGPSEVATVLDCIRRKDARALTKVADICDCKVLRGLGVSFVGGLKQTLVRTQWGEWAIVPLSLVHRSEALGAIAIVRALPRACGMELNRIHVSAAGEHRGKVDTANLLSLLVMDGEITPIGVDASDWLYGASDHANDPEYWIFNVAPLSRGHRLHVVA